MRIVAGAHRGRFLVAPKGHSTRPTADRVREAIFNILKHASWSKDLRGARAIDLFAGSGALGLEAISRGAAHCRFVEHDPQARQAVTANIVTLRLETSCEVVGHDATRLSPRPPRTAAFDLAFLDPPYAEGLAIPALRTLREGGWLDGKATVALEIGARETMPKVDGYTVLDERTWGAAKVVFLELS